MASKIRRDDEVMVIAGRDKGKLGRVMRLLKGGKVIVSGINLLKKHQKPIPAMNVLGAIVTKEGPIDGSNVLLYNPKTQKADRVGFRFEDATKVRFFKSTGERVGA